MLGSDTLEFCKLHYWLVKSLPLLFRLNLNLIDLLLSEFKLNQRIRTLPVQKASNNYTVCSPYHRLAG
jgi:hypothetical protein